MSWQVGNVRIHKVVEIEMKSGVTWILPDATREALAREPWLVPHFADRDGRALMSVHTFVIEADGRRILVDTCVGNDKKRPIPGWDRRSGPFLDDLAAAGFPAESIDGVLCTHLHVDHVGWNTRLEGGRWVPTFPRARYLFHRREFDYWRAEEDPMFADVFGDSVQPVFDAGLVDLVEADHRIGDCVALEPTPGHTPGHVSVRIRSGGQEAVITGDLMHHPVQCAHPDWASSADVDADQARKTRHEFIRSCADAPVLVLGTHFAGPSAGHIVRRGQSHQFQAATDAA
ncbi:MAG: MBL fold metallo-hydrolase [Proteobacteria bacterium]|nr:MBL fold metallo-hydrolase [Pseudomonadota bacterium]